MFKQVILLFCAVAVCSVSMAQVKKKIKKGRRNKSESQFMLDENYFQAEWEVGQETLTDKLNTTVYPNLVMRYGINKQFEINAEVSLLTARDKSSQKKNTTGIEPVAIGANYLLLSETAKRPAIIFSGQFAVPFLATKSFTATYWAPALELIVEKAVSQQVILAASGGAFWDGFSTQASFIYNGNISYNLTKKWALTSEWFGFINGTPQHNTDLSITYTLNKSVQFGATAGAGLSAAAHKNYIAINGVWGCSTKRKR